MGILWCRKWLGRKGSEVQGSGFWSQWPGPSDFVKLEPLVCDYGNLCDFVCGSGFQLRSYDDSYKATFFAAGSRSHENLM